MSLLSGTGRISDAETEKTVRAAKLYHCMSPRQRRLLAQVKTYDRGCPFRVLVV